MEIEIATTRVIYDPIHDPIDIGEEGAECFKYRARANFVAFNGRGEYECKDYLVFNIFALSEVDARQKVGDFFKTLNSDAERQGMDIEIGFIEAVLRKE